MWILHRVKIHHSTLQFFSGPNGQSIPALVKDTGNQTFRVEFCPKFVGEHKICVSYRKVPMAGSPFSSKVYDVNAIRVKPSSNGTVGQPVTFISKLISSKIYGRLFHSTSLQRSNIQGDPQCNTAWKNSTSSLLGINLQISPLLMSMNAYEKT